MSLTVTYLKEPASHSQLGHLPYKNEVECVALIYCYNDYYLYKTYTFQPILIKI